MQDRPESEIPADADGRELAARYEAALPEEERAARGTFYTPPALAGACCRWAIRRGPGDEAGADRCPRVLDPAAGGGAFVVAALDRLRELGWPGEEVPGRVTAVDVDGDALALARRRAPGIDARERSFFDLDPDGVGRFDAVVGNPPFVRQEGLDKERVRAHLAALGPAGETPYLDGERAIDRRSDAYVYFLTNATRFLRPGGRLAMVLPTKWLATRYGERLQRFLLDHYRIDAVVGFDRRAFDAALVDAALVCLRRAPVPGGERDADRERDAGGGHDAGEEHDAGGERAASAERDDPVGEGSVRFVRVADERPARSLAAVLAGRDPEPRTVAVEQSALEARGPGKLAHYLDAPPGAVDLLDHDGLIPLAELATVAYGEKTGANEFFFLDGDDPVADRFRAPAVTSFRELSGPVLASGEAPAAVLDVHDYVEAVAERGGSGVGADGGSDSGSGLGADGDDGRDVGSGGRSDGESGDGSGGGGRARDDTGADGGHDAGADSGGDHDLATAVLDAMERDGHGETAAYVRAGERAGYDERRTCAARRVWFDLGPLARPPVLHPKFFDERVAVVHNRAGAVPSNAIDCLSPRDGVPVEPLLGALESSLHRLALECWGRTEGGGALQLMTYELERVPVADVRAVDPPARERVAAAYRDLVDGGGSRRALDAAVLDAAGIETDPERVAALRETLVSRRIEGATSREGGR